MEFFVQKILQWCFGTLESTFCWPFTFYKRIPHLHYPDICELNANINCIMHTKKALMILEFFILLLVLLILYIFNAFT